MHVYACLCCVMDVPMRGQNTFCTICLKMYVIHCDSFPNKPTQVKLQTIAWSQCSPWRKPPHPLFARCAASSSHLRPEHLSLWSLKSPRGCNEHLTCRTPPDVGFQCKDGDQPKLMQSINITPPIVHASHGNGKSIYRGFSWIFPKKHLHLSSVHGATGLDLLGIANGHRMTMPQLPTQGKLW